MWELYRDGFPSMEGSRPWLILIPPTCGEPLRYALTFTFKATNNEALITGLRLSRGVAFASLSVKCDSHLVVNHIKGEYKAKCERMKKYLIDAMTLINDTK